MKEKKLFMYNYEDDFNKQDMYKWLVSETAFLKNQHTESVLKSHLQIFKQRLKFKQPNLLNYELLMDLQETFILPMMIKPGRSHFFIRDYDKFDEDMSSSDSFTEEESKAGQDPLAKKFYYSRHVIPVREEQLPKIAKSMKRELTSKKFTKEDSVFRNWIDDSPQTYQNCLAHDFQYWKLAKFIKDEAEVHACEDVIRRNFKLIKEIFIQIVAKGGSPPDIGQLEFHQFCQDAGIFDSHFTPRVLDIAFAAVNFEEEEQDGNDDRALIRFEFSEILVRMVKTKYIETKKC